MPGSDTGGPRRLSLRYGFFSKPLLTVFGGGPARSSIVADRSQVTAKMGFWFEGRATVAAVTRAREVSDRVISRGVHGWSGDWLVNGAGDGLVELRFEPTMKARVLGVPIHVRRLRIAVDDPAGLVAAIGPGTGV